MKWKLVLGLGITAAAMWLAFSAAPSGAADDGAALYKSKCAGCHGSQGEGKPAVKAPAVKGTAMTADQIAGHITKGEPNSKPPHKKGISGVTDAQAKAIADFIKTL